jgi:hypothetical protein
MQSGLYDENNKRNDEPLYDMKHLLFEFSLFYGVGMMKVTTFLNCRNRSFK